jgi:hypothetical protein
MAKLDLSKILVQGATLEVRKHKATSAHVKKTIQVTRVRQDEILKNRSVSQEKLEMIVQL